MNIYINEQKFTFDRDVKLLEALVSFEASKPFAILLNDEFLPQSDHQFTWLKDNDKVVVVGAIQGG
ncbi:sulfur carrier protein ThiS [Thiomicrorhabdus lithotrophica]|uniref:Sulfur carrier protein ThiS n=1 Tax=Thiomicrorhabdus lithotrophica TaxID=2949997 RepID=A0ABY8CCF7_9GAMM|nr:sulfur carrier protein ThiS [Thiomicrorhabdus lithotrophica]WEJ63681.1 sulfur carrier protein ThiS [Thiomicrorhabdus lithotrophica]